MSKIIGVTVGTPIGVDKLKEKIKPVTSVDGVKADENGDVKVQRTHWKEVERAVTFFSRTDLTDTTYYHPEPIGLEMGEIYEALYNGIFYDVTPAPYVSYNGDKTGLILVKTGGYSQSNPGVPFTFVEYDEATAALDGCYAFVRPMDGSASAYLAISGNRNTWHKLDKRYLPDELGEVKRVNGKLPDEYGNVPVDVGVKTVNGQAPDESGNVQVETGGSSAQADYAENDPNAAGYVKNRTHWRELELGDVLFDKSLSLTFRESMTVTGSVNDGLVAGNTYLVFWDDVEHKCVCGTTTAGNPYIGDRSIIDTDAAATDYPFCIEGLGGTSYKVYRKSVTTAAKKGKVQAVTKDEYHKLPKEYMPDDLGGGVTDYNKLENRPIYSGGMKTVEYLPEITAVIDPESGEGDFSSMVDLRAGETCTVQWNGVDYICTAQEILLGDQFPALVLGNYNLLMGGTPGDEPFVLMCATPASAAVLGMGGAIMALDGSETVTLSIRGEREDIKKLDGKYLPEGAPYLEPFDDVILPETVLADVMLGSSTSLTKNLNLPVSGLIPGNIYNIILDGRLYSAKAYALVSDGGFSVIALGSGFLDALVMPGLPYTDAPFALMFIQDAAVMQAVGFNVQMKWRGDFEAERMAIVGGKAVRQIDEACLPQCTAPLLLTLTDDESGYTPDRTRGEVLAAVQAKVPVWVSVIAPDGVNQFGLFPMNAWYDYGSLRFGFFDGAVYHNFEWNSDDAFVHEKIHWTDADL